MALATRDSASFGNTEPLYYRGDTEIAGLNVLKFLCALLVIQLHFSSFYYTMLMPVTRIAVPVFFMITGYFLIDKNGSLATRRIKTTFVKILKIYVFVSMVYLAYFLITCIAEPNRFSQSFDSFFSYFSLVFYTLPCGAIHLWYLNALLWSLVVLYVFVRFDKLRLLLWIIPVGLVLNLLMGRYSFVCETLNFDWNGFEMRNFLNFGLPFMLVGMLLRCYQSRLPSRKVVGVIALVCFVGLCVESYLLSDYERYWGDLFFFTIPLAVCIFILFLPMKITGRTGTVLARFGKYYSSDIYLWHFLIGTVFLVILRRLYLESQYSPWVAPTVTIFSICFAMLLRKTKRLKP